jgi:hypothetical protein
MRKEKPPPVQARLLDAQGNLNPMWLKWFQRVGMFFDDFRKAPDITATTDVTLTTDDFGKTVLCDTSASDIICNLPTVSSKDIYCWVTIFRSGANRLTIQPSTGTAIEYGSIHGRIWNDETRRKAANVTLQLISATQWGIIGATGLWKVA